jgi:hypothetical protein
MRVISDVVRALTGQERAVTNARRGATELSRRRVERQDVDLYLADRPDPAYADGVPLRTGDGTRGSRRR